MTSIIFRGMSDVTSILSAIEQGDPHAAEQLLPLVYDELRKLAAAKLAQEKPGQTLEATALVHEAFLRLVDADKASHWTSRGHFFAAAAEAIRRNLVESGRRKRRPKNVLPTIRPSAAKGAPAAMGATASDAASTCKIPAPSPSLAAT
jgi:RNA polymerase sigma factor (TIGR02999 family)